MSSWDLVQGRMLALAPTSARSGGQVKAQSEPEPELGREERPAQRSASHPSSVASRAVHGLSQAGKMALGHLIFQTSVMNLLQVGQVMQLNFLSGGAT